MVNVHELPKPIVFNKVFQIWKDSKDQLTICEKHKVQISFAHATGRSTLKQKPSILSGCLSPFLLPSPYFHPLWSSHESFLRSNSLNWSHLKAFVPDSDSAGGILFPYVLITGTSPFRSQWICSCEHLVSSSSSPLPPSWFDHITWYCSLHSTYLKLSCALLYFVFCLATLEPELHKSNTVALSATVSLGPRKVPGTWHWKNITECLLSDWIIYPYDICDKSLIIVFQIF